MRDAEITQCNLFNYTFLFFLKINLSNFNFYLEKKTTTHKTDLTVKFRGQPMDYKVKWHCEQYVQANSSEINVVF